MFEEWVRLFAEKSARSSEALISAVLLNQVAFLV